MSDIRLIKAGKTYIYVLIDPTNEMVRYVGKSDNIDIRLKEHIRKVKIANTHKNNWILSLLKNDLKPIIKIIDVVDILEWKFWECFWIDMFKTWGFDLTNTANGGGGGNLGAEVNLKISKKLKGRVISDETKEKLKKIKLGSKHSEETKINFSKNRKGELNGMYNKKHSIETKQKIGEKSKINNMGVKNPMYGKKHTEETKQKLSENNKKNFGELNPFYGKKHTDETKQKLRVKVKQVSIEGNLIKVWDSITEAAICLGIKQCCISNVCDKPNRTYYNYKWEKIKN